MNNGTRLLVMMDFEKAIPTSSIDMLILAASVDNRGYAVYEKMVENGVTINQTIIFDYEKFRPNDESGRRDIYYQLENINNVQYVQCNNEGDDSLFLSSLEMVETFSVFLDITSINIPDIFQICFVLKELKTIPFLNVTYAEPKYYEHLNGLYFDYEHHIGERDYKPINEYFTSTISKDVVLVCFLGFDRLVSKYIHERKEHSDVVAVNGFPSYYPKLKDISLEHNYELISAIGRNSVQFTQANNPFSAYNLLTEVKSKNEDKILDICVLGSKPMALGACIFALHNPSNTKVSYPYPVRYKPHTTIETSDIWLYGVDLCL